MPSKIFVGNLPPGITDVTIRELFECHGIVTDCVVLGSYGFVHMENEFQANAAISALNGFDIQGSFIKVELSTIATQGKKKSVKPSTKIFVGNIKIGTTSTQLREIFEPYGEVTESDVIGGYGFVHMANEREAMEAIKDLSGFKLNGSVLNVELSTRETQGKARGQEGFVVSDRGRGGMMPWGPARGRGGRGVLGTRFDPYSAPVPGGSWFPRSDPYGSGAMHMAEPSISMDPYRNPGVMHGVNPHPVAAAALPPRPGASGDDSSFARELLQLYTTDPAAFDAYARNPQVRQSLNLEAEAAVASQMYGTRSSSRDDPYLKPPREYLAEQRMAPAARVVHQPSMMMPSYGRGMAPIQQYTMRPTPGQQHIYMSFE